MVMFPWCHTTTRRQNVNIFQTAAKEWNSWHTSGTTPIVEATEIDVMDEIMFDSFDLLLVCILDYL
jgi:streptogramin lyase